MFISGGKFSAGASRFVASVERSLVSTAAGRRPVPTKGVIHGVCRCVVLTGSEDPGCSCSWSPRRSTSLALFPPTSECSSCSSLVESYQPESRDSLRPSSEALLVLPPAVTLFLTTSTVNKVGRGIISSGSSEDPCCSCSFLTCEGTSPALIPPTPGDLGTRGRRLCVSDTNRLKSRFIRLGRMSIDVGKCRRIHSQLRKSDARHVQADRTKPSAASEKTPTSELLPCLAMQRAANTGCRGRYVLSPCEDELLFQSSTTG